MATRKCKCANIFFNTLMYIEFGEGGQCRKLGTDQCTAVFSKCQSRYNVFVLTNTLQAHTTA